MDAYSSLVTPANALAALLTLFPYLAVAFFPEFMVARIDALPHAAKLLGPALLSIPYILVTVPAGDFHWQGCMLYAALPVCITVLLWQAAALDPAARGNWRDFLILLILGLSIDLRWFEGAWPAHLAVFNKILLLDAGIYGFVLIRKLDGTGFDLRLRGLDLAVGLREAAFYTPIALFLGLGLGFLHLHRTWPGLAPIAAAWIFTFFFIAVPGTFLSRMAAESAGAAHRPHLRAAAHRGALRPRPFQ
jgi:uncharacterized protein